MFLGHAQVSYLETLPELQPERPVKSEQAETNGVSDHHDDQSDVPNGDQDGHSASPNDKVDGTESVSAHLHPTLKALAAHGYIMRVREGQFQSHADNLMYAQRVIKSRSDVKGLRGKKLEEAIEEGAARLVKERTDGDLTRGLIFNGVPRGVKRRHAAGSADGPNKKPKLEDYAVNEEEGDESENEWSDAEDTMPMEVNLPWWMCHRIAANMTVVRIGRPSELRKVRCCFQKSSPRRAVRARHVPNHCPRL